MMRGKVCGKARQANWNIPLPQVFTNDFNDNGKSGKHFAARAARPAKSLILLAANMRQGTPS